MGAHRQVSVSAHILKRRRSLHYSDYKFTTLKENQVRHVIFLFKDYI